MARLEDLGSLIADSIAEYGQDVKEGIDRQTVHVGEATIGKVRNDAPERSGAYKKAIKLKTERQLLGNKKVTIYVGKPHYRLTHLLENGHALQNGGRTRAFPHWKPAEDFAVKEFTEGVTKVIENGGSHEL